MQSRRPAASPRDIVQSAVNRVVVALQKADGEADPTPAQRLAREQRRLDIRRVAADLFDFDEISRRALSRHWTARSPEEQAEFVRLFTDLLERTYIGRIESYSGEKIMYLGEVVDGPFATVRSKVVTRRRTETPLGLQAAFARRPLEGLRRPHRPRQLRRHLSERVRTDPPEGSTRPSSSVCASRTSRRPPSSACGKRARKPAPALVSPA